MKEMTEQFKLFEKQLDSNKMVLKNKFSINYKPVAPALIAGQRNLKWVENTVLDFYELYNGLEIKWKAADEQLAESDMIGTAVILPFLNVMKDWKGVVFFNNTDRYSPRREFFPVDFFADEAAVGFCTKESWRNMMYLFKFEGDLIPLYINFYSYLQLMLKAKACYYWQYLILEIIDKEENETSKYIKENLIKIFPDFSFNEFKDLFNSLRIHS